MRHDRALYRIDPAMKFIAGIFIGMAIAYRDLLGEFDPGARLALVIGFTILLWHVLKAWENKSG